jgi:hypothetical protein
MTNLPEKNSQRVQRRKIWTGKEFRLATQLDEFVPEIDSKAQRIMSGIKGFK